MTDKPSIGGQAVLEGVMMRGPSAWALACRKPNSEIVVEVHRLPGLAERKAWLRWPFFRGVYVLGESLAIGIRALMISANYQLEEEEDKPSEKALGWTMAGAMIFFSAIFILLPAFLSKMGGRWLNFGGNELLENIVEGAIRISFFLGYIFAISFLPDMRRVFQYHGAEHKTIYAYENGDPLTPEVVDRYTTLHVRCGTNFLFIVMFLTIAAHFVMDVLLQGFPLYVRLAARILAIPVLAGGAYEVIKAASRNERSVVFRAASLPGLALQKITTRPPTPDQIEVAIKAMEAVVGYEKLAEPDRVAAQEAQAAAETSGQDLEELGGDAEPGAAPVPPT